jgi:hypothetical protein
MSSLIYRHSASYYGPIVVEIQPGYKAKINDSPQICCHSAFTSPYPTTPLPSFTDRSPLAEAEAATHANVYSIVVDRPGNAPLSDESKAKFAIIQKLTDLP